MSGVSGESVMLLPIDRWGCDAGVALEWWRLQRWRDAAALWDTRELIIGQQHHISPIRNMAAEGTDEAGGCQRCRQPNRGLLLLRGCSRFEPVERLGHSSVEDEFGAVGEAECQLTVHEALLG